MKEEFYSITIPDDTKGRLDKVLAALCEDVSRSRLQNLILDGYLMLDGVLVTDTSYSLKGGESVELSIPPLEQANPTPENIPLEIVYEDQDLLVINKPAGLVVHPAPGNWNGTLVNALLYHCGDSLSGIGGVKRPGIVHRLDKETSGLMVVAKHDKSHAHLTHQFADRSLSRRYHALVWGHVKATNGTIETLLGRSRTNRKKMAVLRGSGKLAITHYEVKNIYSLKASHVECSLETGRTHQIRVHMAHIGHPVIGDKVYGKRPKSINQSIEQEIENIIGADRHLLHAFHIHFIHPTTNEGMQFEIEDPIDMQQAISLLAQK